MNIAIITRAIRKYRNHPVVPQAAQVIREELSEAVARFAARMESPVLWSTFHRIRATQIKGHRWFPGKNLMLAHHWRMARRYAAMAETEELMGYTWATEKCSRGVGGVV